jgi:Ca-activated chloride channel family protein
VALDVSNSMLAQDIKPDRLSRAKMEIADLMTRLGGNEIGLVLFSGASFIQFPLTADYNTAMTFLDSARPQVISKQGTDMGDAIRTALGGFDFERPSQKVLVLMTDGEAHDADVTDMAQQAADQGVLIYTVGFGSAEGEPIPVYDDAGNVTGYKRDQAGEVVLSKLDEATLQQVAEIGGGSYTHAGAGGDLSALTAELDGLQKSALSTQVETWGIERYQLVLWVALLALLLHEFIPDRLRQKITRRAAMGKQATQTP